MQLEVYFRRQRRSHERDRRRALRAEFCRHSFWHFLYPIEFFYLRPSMRHWSYADHKRFAACSKVSGRLPSGNIGSNPMRPRHINRNRSRCKTMAAAGRRHIHNWAVHQIPERNSNRSSSAAAFRYDPGGAMDGWGTVASNNLTNLLNSDIALPSS